MTARIRVHVTPNARIEEYSVREGVIQVSVKAPPVEDKANRRTEQVLAAALGVPKSNVILVKGNTSRLKTLEVSGLTPAEIMARLQPNGL